MFRLFILAGIVLSFATDANLIGRWESKSPTGVVTGVVFKDNQTFDGYINRKPFVTGKYFVSADTLFFTDNGCDGAEGIYKTVFFSNGDSLKFTTIYDTCTRRRNGMERLNMGRVK